MMKEKLIFLMLIAIVGCKTSKVKNEEPKPFYVGTYTNGESKGIYKYQLDKYGKLSNLGLMVETLNPTFLVKSNDQKTLYSVAETNENGTGYVKSFKILDNSLVEISTQKSGGGGPCFITVNKDNYILTANYGGGSVGLLRSDKKGNLSQLLNVQQHIGKGTTKRQTKPHAHSTWFHPSKKEIISVDLGTNELWFSKIDKESLVLSEQSKLKMADGAGPRHLTFHPNYKWIYVLNELNNTVSLVKENGNFYVVASSISMLPEGYSKYTKGADIHISKDGKFVYASNRGHNSIVIYKVNPENGSLILVGFEDVRGDHPRNFSLSPDNKFLIVANQNTNNIVSFKRDKKSGKLTFVSEITAPNPVCILF